MSPLATGDRPLLLWGMMGSGKSAVGAALAARAGVPFQDLDRDIERQTGRTVAALFAEGGEAYFRRIERAAVAAALEDRTVRVVALGGGALLDCELRLLALRRCRVVTLRASVQTLVARVSPSSAAAGDAPSGAAVRPLLASGPARGLDGSFTGIPADTLARLAAERTGAYAETHQAIDTDDLAIEAVVDAVAAVWRRTLVAVALGRSTYCAEISIGVDEDGETAAAAARCLRQVVGDARPWVVSDENVWAQWGPAVEASFASCGVAPAQVLLLPPGERHKTLASVEPLLKRLVEGGADRSSVLVAIGGGVVSDIAGFMASVLYRGVRWMAVPTTLLAMVDASVGGKTGVDLGWAKNAVGTFHQPIAVAVDVRFLRTESDRGFRSGLAEVVKSALVGDPELFERMECHPLAFLERDPVHVALAVERSLQVKAAIVSSDEREGGARALLNLGHTVGHALEAEGGFDRWTHGESVAMGLVAAMKVGVALGTTSAGLAARVEALLGALGLPHQLPTEAATALRHMKFDKKRQGAGLRFVLVREPGDCVLRASSPGEVARALGLPQPIE